MSTDVPIRKILSYLREAEKADDKARAMRELRRYLEDRSEEEERTFDQNHVRAIEDRYARLSQKAKLKPGDIVAWKPDLKNRRRPSYGEPVVVVEVLLTPRYTEKEEASTPYFFEPLDIVLGLLDEDGDFVCYHFDSRRFHLYDAKAPDASQ